MANTTAVKTEANCNLMSTVCESLYDLLGQVNQLLQVSTPNGFGGWTNNATFNGCTFSYQVNKSTPHLFGTDIMPDCGAGTTEYFRPIVLWFFTYDSTPPQSSATHCAPVISLWEVEAQVDIASMNMTSVKETRPFNASTSPFASSSSNITGAPLNGQAYNGVSFNVTNPDQFVFARGNATNLQLPASILQAAQASPSGLPEAFRTNSFVGMATNVYVSWFSVLDMVTR